MRSPRRSKPRIYELMVMLSDVEPPVWRRLRLSSGVTLARAVRVIAVAMGWPAARPYAFTRESLRYEGRGPTLFARGETGDEPRLRQLLHDPGAEMELEYGDGHAWHLVLRLERILPPSDQVTTPWCEAGAGSAPPIDVGGPWGYEEWRAERDDVADIHPVAPLPSKGHVPSLPSDAHILKSSAIPVPRFNTAHVNAQLERLR